MQHERICGALGCRNDADVIVRHESGRRTVSCRECLDSLHPNRDGITVEEEL